MPVTAKLNTLAYAKKLKAAGFTDEQAEIQAEALAEIIEVGVDEQAGDMERPSIIKCPIRVQLMSFFTIISVGYFFCCPFPAALKQSG